MHKLVIVALCVGVAVVCARPDDKYDSKYDNIDVEKILNNDRVLNQYTDCILREDDKNRRGCPNEAWELRNHLPQAITTKCAKCTETQKTQTKKVVAFLVNKKPAIWAKLRARFDPNGEFEAKYKDDLAAITAQG